MAAQPNSVPAYQQPFELVVAALGSDARQGLSHEEARARLEKYGRNELASDPPVPAWRKFLVQFQDVLVMKNEGVVSRSMWVGIFFVGLVMAAGTLLVLDASLPGGLINGSGDLRGAQTMAFTTLMLFQLVNVFNARSDTTSAFTRLFTNWWLWAALGLSLALHVLVIYTPFLQQAFSTTGLSLRDWLLCVVVASSVLWMRELSKAVARAMSPDPSDADPHRRAANA